MMIEVECLFVEKGVRRGGMEESDEKRGWGEVAVERSYGGI